MKAIARAFRWQRQIDNGEVASINELAEAEGLSPTYVGGILQLALLAPGLVEQILNGDDQQLVAASVTKGSVASLWARNGEELT